MLRDDAAGRRARRHLDFEEQALPLIDAVRRFAHSLTADADEADDLVQDTYLKAFRAWASFTPGTNLRAWLFTICKNTFRQRYARERMRVRVEADGGDEDALPIVLTHVAAESMGLGDLFDRLDVVPALEKGLDGLSALHRAIVGLVDIDGMSYAEAARVLDIPVGTVRSRLFRARRRLQESLIEQARDLGIGGEPTLATRSEEGRDNG